MNTPEYKIAIETLKVWHDRKTELETQRNVINDSLIKQQQAGRDLDALVEQRKQLILTLEDAAAESALSGVDTTSKLQKQIDSLDKAIKEAGTATANAEAAAAGLLRRLQGIESDLDDHQNKLAGLQADLLQAEGEAAVKEYASLHDKLVALHAVIQSRGILAARLRGSSFPRLETPFKNRAPEREVPKYSTEQGSFPVAEHAETLRLMAELNKSGCPVTLPSGGY